MRSEHTRRVQFHFTPVQLIDQVLIEPIPSYEDLLFILSKSKIDPQAAFCAPKLAHS